MRIHEELRESNDDAGLPAPALPDPISPAAAKPVAFLPKVAESLAARMESLEAKIASASPSTAWWRSSSAAGLLIGLLVAAAGFAVWIQNRVESRLAEADARVAAADRQRDAAAQLASKEITATRAEAGKQVAAAQQTALQAHIVGSVLAAPDVVRYDLNGTGAAPRSYAKVTWSRSRGLLFSASRLPVLKAGTAYQFWLITRSGPFNAGLITPDAAGRVTFVTDSPGDVPRPVTGAMVTLEPAGGRPRPSGKIVLEQPSR
jgi:hypothetical protein